jgi:ketosteroid isomerase-like protein
MITTRQVLPVRHLRLVYGLLALCQVLAGCTASSPDHADLAEEDFRAIRAAQQLFVQAELAGNWAAAANVFSERAVRMQPNEPWIEGRAAIQRAIESANIRIQSFTLTPVETVGGGSLAVDRGKYTFAFTIPTTGARVNDIGKYLTVWRKESDGVWRIVTDIYNSDLPVDPSGC